MAEFDKSKVLSQWYDLLKKTQKIAGVSFDDEVEAYLILTLDNYTFDITLLEEPIGVEYLQSLTKPSTERVQTLRRVGDHCLLITGLFPERADKMVSVSYYVDIGQQAYLNLSQDTNLKASPELFQNLGVHFIEIKKVLNELRNLSVLPDSK